MKIAIIHFGKRSNTTEIVSNLDENEQNLLNLNIQAAKEGADLIVNPELSILSHPSASNQLQITSGAVTLNRTFTKWFAEERSPQLIERLRTTVALPYRKHIVVGTITSMPGHCLFHNSALVIGPEHIQHIYHKRILTDDVVFSCVKGFSALFPVNLTIGNLGVIICGDYSAPLIARSLALNGCDLIVIIAAITSSTANVLRVRARENGIPFALANCYNRDQQYTEPWVPESSIVSAHGQVLDSYSGCNDKILWADLDLFDPAMQRLKTEKLRGRHPESYAGALVDMTSPLLRIHTMHASTEPLIQLVTISGAATDQYFADECLDTIIRTAAKDNLPVIIVLPEFPLGKKDIQKHLRFGVERKVFIVCGFTENNFRVISLFDPFGQEILTYKKVHLSKEEFAIIQPGERLESYTDHLVGRIGILSGEDLLYPEAVEVHKNAGVDLLLVASRLGFDGAIVFSDVALSRKMHVAVADYRYNGGIYERYGASNIPHTVNSELINDYQLNIEDGRSRTPTNQLSGLEVLVRFEYPNDAMSA